MDNVTDKRDFNFITRAELLERFRISETTLWKLMYKRNLPFYKLQRKVLFRDDEIEEYFMKLRNT
ncbi:MAG: helix-turn-helix domain-containing protein, partial [Bacteroidales bacterium]|nr:helix-turn-helix domain-containing protein [Bacteroidales bacterium]